jgi:hypothetical protein
MYYASNEMNLLNIPKVHFNDLPSVKAHAKYMSLNNYKNYPVYVFTVKNGSIVRLGYYLLGTYVSDKVGIHKTRVYQPYKKYTRRG